MKKEKLRKIIENNFEEFDHNKEAPQMGFVDEIMDAICKYVFAEKQKAKKESLLEYLEQQLKKIRLFIQEIIEDSSLAGDLKLTWKAYCDIMVTAHEITQQPLTILEKRLVDRINIQLETTHDLGVNGDDSKIECKEFLRNMLLELPKASPQFLGGAGIEKSAQHPEEGSDHASKPSSKGFGASES